VNRRAANGTRDASVGDALELLDAYLSAQLRVRDHNQRLSTHVKPVDGPESLSQDGEHRRAVLGEQRQVADERVSQRPGDVTHAP